MPREVKSNFWTYIKETNFYLDLANICLKSFRGLPEYKFDKSYHNSETNHAVKQLETMDYELRKTPLIRLFFKDSFYSTEKQVKEITEEMSEKRGLDIDRIFNIKKKGNFVDRLKLDQKMTRNSSTDDINLVTVTKQKKINVKLPILDQSMSANRTTIKVTQKGLSSFGSGNDSNFKKAFANGSFAGDPNTKNSEQKNENLGLINLKQIRPSFGMINSPKNLKTDNILGEFKSFGGESWTNRNNGSPIKNGNLAKTLFSKNMTFEEKKQILLNRAKAFPILEAKFDHKEEEKQIEPKTIQLHRNSLSSDLSSESFLEQEISLLQKRRKIKLPDLQIQIMEPTISELEPSDQIFKSSVDKLANIRKKGRVMRFDKMVPSPIKRQKKKLMNTNMKLKALKSMAISDILRPQFWFNFLMLNDENRLKINGVEKEAKPSRCKFFGF
jgi:hypothetical protein